MSIFRRGDKGDAQQTITPPETAAQATETEPVAKWMPPAASATPARSTAAPGVVPPPAAPIYSMRAPETPARVDADSITAADRGVHGDAQHASRVATQRARTPVTSATGIARRPVRQSVPVSSQSAVTRQAFDPIAAAQAGLLNLAWRWQEVGAPIRAIHTYMALIARHPGTPAAAAAVADLVELSNKLAEQGHFHIALSIYDEMEELQQMGADE